MFDDVIQGYLHFRAYYRLSLDTVRYSVLYRIEYSIVLYRTMYTVPYNCSGEITVTAAGFTVL